MRGVRLWVLVCLAIFLLLAGCSSSNSDSANMGKGESPGDALMSSAASADMDVAYEAKTDDGMKAEETSGNGGSTAGAPPNEPGMEILATGAAPDSLERKIIYKANIAMQVKKYNETQSAIRDLVHINSGYILQFTDHATLNEVGGTFVVKIPARGFTSFISELERMKPLSLQRTMAGQDVTEEFVDLDSRLKAKHVVEARLLSFMEKAEKAADLVSFSNELGRVQEEIERIKGRMRYLEQNVAYSTIELRVYETQDGQQIMGEKEKPAYKRAMDAMLDSLKGIGHFFEALLVFAAGALPVLLLLAVIGIPLVIFYRRSLRDLVKTKMYNGLTAEKKVGSPRTKEASDEEDSIK